MGLPGFGTCGKLSFLTNQVSNSKISAVVVSLWWVWEQFTGAFIIDTPIE